MENSYFDALKEEVLDSIFVRCKELIMAEERGFTEYEAIMIQRTSFRAEGYKCKNCGYERIGKYSVEEFKYCPMCGKRIVFKETI